MIIQWEVCKEKTLSRKNITRIVRSWPCAVYKDGRIAAKITCPEQYEPWKIEKENHAELSIAILNYSDDCKYFLLKERFFNLDQAKRHTEKFIRDNEIFQPK